MSMRRGTPVIFYKSLNRKFHVLGVNQRLFYLLLPFSGSIAMAWGFKPEMILVAVIASVILHAIGVLVTKADDQMLEVYNRHRQYRAYYAPVAGIHAKVRKPQMSVPYYQGKRGLV